MGLKMTEKQKNALGKLLAAIPEECRNAYREVAEYTITLGYIPTIKGAHDSYADFSKSKVKKTLLKIDTDPHFPPRLAMKFFATHSYSALFQQAVEARLAQFTKFGYGTGCGSCGKCDGTHGYTYTYPDGKQVFLCGRELLDLPSFSADNVSEVKEALRRQDELFVKCIS